MSDLEKQFIAGFHRGFIAGGLLIGGLLFTYILMGC